MSQLTLLTTDKDHIKGNPDALVTLVEYGDYECPFCREAHFIIQRIQNDAGDQMQFVFRNFPLTEVHPHALPAALAAEAAGLQGKFWEMHDLLYARQDNLEVTDLLSYAEDIGLDREQFIRDTGSDEVVDKVQADIESGVNASINGTPTFFINGRLYDESYEYDVLMPVIQQETDTTMPS